MEDRELLELAAKAAGIEIAAIIGDTFWTPDGFIWNPLDLDADAFRLAVKLGIEIGNYHQHGRALAFFGFRRGINEFWEINPDDHCAATRRAIVRAAAAITQATPSGVSA